MAGRGIVTSANIVEVVDERKLDLVGGLRMDRRFKIPALKTSLGSFGKAFALKNETLRAKEFVVKIGGEGRRCILYYSRDKAERDGKCLKWEVNESAIKEEEVLDGRYWLVTKALEELKIMTKLAKRDIDTSEAEELLSAMVEWE